MRTTSKLALLCATLSACMVDTEIYMPDALPSGTCGTDEPIDCIKIPPRSTITTGRFR